MDLEEVAVNRFGETEDELLQRKTYCEAEALKYAGIIERHAAKIAQMGPENYMEYQLWFYKNCAELCENEYNKMYKK